MTGTGRQRRQHRQGGDHLGQAGRRRGGRDRCRRRPRCRCRRRPGPRPWPEPAGRPSWGRPKSGRPGSSRPPAAAGPAVAAGAAATSRSSTRRQADTSREPDGSHARRSGTLPRQSPGTRDRSGRRPGPGLPAGSRCRGVMVEGRAGPDHQVLKDLTGARRRRRIADFDPFEALYRAYVTGIVLVVAVLVLSCITGDTKVSRRRGRRPAPPRRRRGRSGGRFVLAVGIRSGGRGGPLVVEAADVRHVLLAPDRPDGRPAGPGRPPACASALLVGAVAGAIAGLLAVRRLPGSPIALGRVRGARRSHHRRGRASAWPWSCRAAPRPLDRRPAGAWRCWPGRPPTWRSGTVTSPASLLGQLALWPLAVHPLDLVDVWSWPRPPSGRLALVGGDRRSRPPSAEPAWSARSASPPPCRTSAP